jgi:molybdopterin/thiamine biosynthesis adenylyltransferase
MVEFLCKTYRTRAMIIDIMQDSTFHYEEAFSRNIGLITEEEQNKLRNSTVAIPGMGGVGGIHLISLVRQGFEHFKIADLDLYEMKNMNRQFGARPDTVGRPKVEVMREEALKINPNCQIEVFTDGVNAGNIDRFLEGVDIAIDAIDIFQVDAYRLFFKEAKKRGVPVVFAAPIGFGAAFFVFDEKSPDFDTYFNVDDATPYYEKLAHFLLGLMPSMLQRAYMSEANVSLKEKRGPSSVGSVDICAGVVTITVLKILLKKGKVKALPYYHQFDVMRNKYVIKRLWFGNKNPLQKIKIFIAKRKYLQ